MSFPILLLLSAIVPQPQLLTGFVENGSQGGYWTGGTAFTATVDETGIVLKRGPSRFPIRFPKARLRWQPHGESVGAIHRIGEGSQRSFASLRAADALPGVDVLLLETRGVLKSEFHLNPGIRPDSVRYCFEGV